MTTKPKTTVDLVQRTTRRWDLTVDDLREILTERFAVKPGARFAWAYTGGTHGSNAVVSITDTEISTDSVSEIIDKAL